MDGLDNDENRDDWGNEVTVWLMKKIDEEVVTGNPDFPDQIRHHLLCKSTSKIQENEKDELLLDSIDSTDCDLLILDYDRQVEVVL